MTGYKKKFASLSKEDQAQVLVYESAIKAARRARHRIIDRVGHRKKRAKRVLNDFSDRIQARLDVMSAEPNESENRPIDATMKDLCQAKTMTYEDMHKIYSALGNDLDADDIWENKTLVEVMEHAKKDSELYQDIITKYIISDSSGFDEANKVRYAPTITAEEERDKYQYEQQIKKYQAAIEAIFNK